MTSLAYSGPSFLLELVDNAVAGSHRPQVSTEKVLTEDDIYWVLSNPVGKRADFPREGIAVVAEFATNAIPMVVLIDMRRSCVFHAQRLERKYEHLFRS